MRREAVVKKKFQVWVFAYFFFRNLNTQLNLGREKCKMSRSNNFGSDTRFVFIKVMIIGNEEYCTRIFLQEDSRWIRVCWDLCRFYW